MYFESIQGDKNIQREIPKDIEKGNKKFQDTTDLDEMQSFALPRARHWEITYGSKQRL